MQEVSDEVMKYVTEHYPHELPTIAERNRLRHFQRNGFDQKSNRDTCGVWGGSSYYQWIFNSIWEKSVPDYGEPEDETKSVMLVYALAKVEHEYYNNGFCNVDMDRYYCPIVATHEFSWDWWQMFQFLYSVSPSMRKVMTLMKQRHEQFQCEQEEDCEE
jgi:hypothetical protein